MTPDEKTTAPTGFGHVVGHRKPPPISLDANAELLRAACAWNESMQQLPTGKIPLFQKGVYRYRTHEEAQAHFDQCVSEKMARIALDRVDHGPEHPPRNAG